MRYRVSINVFRHITIANVRSILYSWIAAKKAKAGIFLRLDNVCFLYSGARTSPNGPIDRYHILEDLEKLGIGSNSWDKLTMLTGESPNIKDMNKPPIYIDGAVEAMSKTSMSVLTDVVTPIKSNVRGKTFYCSNTRLPIWWYSVYWDFLMGITNIMRGEDQRVWEPQYLQLRGLLTDKPIQFDYLPLIVNDQGQPFNKTSGIGPTFRELKERHSVQAILDYAFWSGLEGMGKRETRSLGDMVTEFDLSAIRKENTVFSEGDIS